MALLVGLGAAFTACASDGSDGEPRTIIFSPRPDGLQPESSASSGSGSTSGAPGGSSSGSVTSTGTAPDGRPGLPPQPETPVDTYRLRPDGHHLDAKFRPESNLVARARTECDVGPDDLDMIQCIVQRGPGGRYLVWTGVDPTSRGLQVRLHREQQENRWEVVATSVLTRDFEEVLLYEGVSGGEPWIMVEYDLDRQGNVHDFDFVTFPTDQEEPAVAATLHGLISPMVDVGTNEVVIQALNYFDGAELCCPNYKDIFRVMLDPEEGWLALATTEPIR